MLMVDQQTVIIYLLATAGERRIRLFQHNGNQGHHDCPIDSNASPNQDSRVTTLVKMVPLLQLVAINGIQQ